jgi:meiotically up-regulated gene 157 (Mug157) protein
MVYFGGAVVLLSCVLTAAAQCPDYSQYSNQRHGPYSLGKYKLSYQRPDLKCRTFTSQAVEDVINQTKSAIADPDLGRLFENSFPNTLDTAVKYHGTTSSGEELTFLITGDIDAMWLRDSANQMQSYQSLLTASTSNNSIASLYRGVINLQARYISTSPYCNSFNAPVESGIRPGNNGGANGDNVFPSYDPVVVFECKYELDSLAAFLQVSTEYYEATKDADFFGKFNWVKAVNSLMMVATDMQTPTYAANGSVNSSPYTWQRSTTRASETLENDGVGNPVQNGTGLIRSAFRPSDDATIYQLFIPANMMFARYLHSAAKIMAKLPNQEALTQQMADLASSIRTAIYHHGVITHPIYGKIYAYEVDGFGSYNIMDDANIPSLLSAPHLGYLSAKDPVYQSTREMILSAGNPYFMRGPVINAVGGPHNGPGYAWPMASIVRILTSDDDDEIKTALKEILSSTDALGLIHESVWSFQATRWTRQWYVDLINTREKA